MLSANKNGLGDIVSSAIKTVTRGKVKECGKCRKRKNYLNDKVLNAGMLNPVNWMMNKGKK